MDLLKILRKIQAFEGLKDSDLSMIIPLLEEEKFPAGAKVIRQGAMGDSMYIMISGSVNVVVLSTDGKQEFTINKLKDEDYFGEPALIDNMPRSASVITAKPSIILRLRKTVFDRLIQDNPEIARIFYKNCLLATFKRYREMTKDISFFRHNLEEKETTLEEISRDLTSAKKLQDFFINTRLLDYRKYPIRGLKQSYLYNPSQEIGGDFINLTPFSEYELGAVIADVMGHGITAALATGAFKSAYALMVRAYGQHPTQLLDHMNKHFFDDISSLFASCHYALINLKEHTIRMARAGHYFPLFYDSAKNCFIRIKSIGPALGIIKNAEFEEVTLSFKKGDKLLFFTDGIIEQRNPDGLMYSEERLQKVFLRLIAENSEDILSVLEKDFSTYCGDGKREDDISMMLLEFV